MATAPACDFKSDQTPGDLETPFLRALRTEPFEGSPLCPYLEQPNAFTGLPAQGKERHQHLDEIPYLYNVNIGCADNFQKKK